MEKQKKSKKARSNGNGKARPHHPWDEVSLPGAGGSPLEQEPTILQVINNKINVTSNVVKEEDLTSANANVSEETEAAVSKEQTQQEQKATPSQANSETSSDYLVNSHSERSAESNSSSSVDSESITPPSQPSRQHSPSPQPTPTTTDQTNVLDIESHLIETYDDYQAGEDSTSSVGIKELQPIQDELTQGSSKIESPSNVRTVIEIEPAAVKISKPQETLVQIPQSQLVVEILEKSAEATAEPEIVEAAFNEINVDIKETPKNLINEIESDGFNTTQPHPKVEVIKLDTEAIAEPEIVVSHVEEISEEISEEIKRTAENLVNEIEREVLATFNKEATKIEKAQLIENTNEIDTVDATDTSETIQEPSTTNQEENEKTETPATLLDEINSTLSRKVDVHLSEVTSILKSSASKQYADVSLNLRGVNGENLKVAIDEKTPDNKQLKLVDGPLPKTSSEAEERKLFIESLPQIVESVADTDAQKLAADCKREYYQSLKKYLIQSSTDKPPVPLQTYRWEDLKRAKERGGYPWTHLYKRPLGPNEEPEIILLLRKSQELRFTSESPKSLKKVRIDDQVLVKEAERYIQELTEDEDEEEEHENETIQQEYLSTSDTENHSLRSESISCVSDSVLATGSSHTKQPRKSNRLAKIRGILKRRKSGRSSDDAQSLPGTSTQTSRHHSEEILTHNPPNTLHANANNPPTEQKSPGRCYPIMKKLKSMADRQKKRLNIKRITLHKDEKIVLDEETKILRLKSSPKSDRGEIPHFIEKQDSDDVLEIVELDESPSRKRKDDGRGDDEIIVERVVVNGGDVAVAEAPTSVTIETSIVEPDEIIEIPSVTAEQQLESETATVPRKTPRLRREHVYEEIEQGDTVGDQLNDILEMASVEALKQSLAKQDNYAIKDIEAANKPLPLDRMGSSEEEPITIGDDVKPNLGLLAPISSIDSASSEEDRAVRAQLSPVAEESDASSIDGHHHREIAVDALHEEAALHKPSIKKEASPAPSDKKVVTFSHVEDEAEPHREDIELPDDVMEATAAAANNKWKNMSDHEYEPIGDPSVEDKPSAIAKEHSPAQPIQTQNGASKLAMEIEALRDEMKDAEEMQKDLEERYFSSEATTPRTESRTDYEIRTSQVDSSALEELPLKPENCKKGFMASAQDRTRKMQAGFKNQAGKIKTKLRSPAKKPPSGSPKVKDRKRFKAPEFSKIKMPDIKRPDMSKLKDFKRPEFTKFNKPDMSKFKLPEKFSTLKLRRSKSFKENETTHDDDEMSGITPESGVTSPEAQPQPQKKKFEFNFGTYPRAFRKKKKPEIEPELSFGTGTGTEGPSIIPSTETQPSVESSSSPQGDRGPGPVRSRWADKFSDVSYNDSEGSRYRRYGSEQESFDRESSLERRMKEDLEEETTGSEAAPEMGILGGVADNKQFAEFDEENRAIHEISNLRAGEFKRRPMVHQDSDLRSEDSKDAEGWTDKEIQKNKLLRKAELEAEASYLKYPSEEGIRQETLSTASSGKKVVMEEIDDDEFFLRKRGISEDNIELRQYISNAIREGYDMPINALQHVGQTGSEPMEYGDYDVPPPKPRRMHRNYRPEDGSQEFERSDYGDDLSMSQNGSDFFGAPKRPLRKGGSRSKYSMDSQDIPMADERISREQYFDDDEDYLRPPRNETTKVAAYKEDGMGMNNLDFSRKDGFSAEQDEEEIGDASTGPPRPHPPRRRKRQLRESSIDKDSYVNGFSGRSVSNSYLQPPDDVIVYRTEHEYHIPLATPENYNTPDGASAASQKSRSTSHFDEDERTSRGLESITSDAANRHGRNVFDEDEDDTKDIQEKFIIDMMENDGYAVVRKEPMPKPTPPARRKKFSRSPGERFATMPNVPRTKRNTSPPERPPPPRGYTPSAVVTADNHDEPVPPPPERKSALSLDAPQNYEDDDYEEPAILDHERPESPRNLQSGEIINKMKYRPLPPPPRPPREKRQRAESKESTIDDSVFGDGGGTASEMLATSSTADSYDQNADFEDDVLRFAAEEVEVSTQTDPLPDDYVCEEFEITDDMKVIEPSTRIAAAARTLDELLRAQEQHEQEAGKKDENGSGEHTPLTEDEQLARGLQRFRDANQRSISERSRATSSGDRSKSQSRPQTPSSAVIIERRISTPVPTQQQHGETMLEAALIVRPIDDLDLEEEALRREGLLSDSSQQSKSDVEEIRRRLDEESAASATEEEESSKIVLSDYSQAPSSDELNKALEEGGLLSHEELESERDDEMERKDEYDDEVELTMRAAIEQDEDAEVERTMRDYAYDEQKAERRYSSHYDDQHEEEEYDKQEIKLSYLASNLSAYPEHKLEDDVKEEVSEDPVKYDYERKRSADREQLDTVAARLKRIEAEMMITSDEEEPPQPPPRRKSTTTIEPTTIVPIEAISTTEALVEEQQATPQEVTQVQSLVEPPPTQLPSRLMDLEVDRLRVHALQAGQIMVSQLHGTQISADELQSKSGSLVVQNIELPPGFIEDIVERVRTTSQGSVSQLLTVETQTSLPGSNETLTQPAAATTYDDELREQVPPPKPPRHRDLEAAKSTTTEQPTDSEALIAAERLRNLEQGAMTTQPATMSAVTPASQPMLPPPVYATAEYFQTLAPLAFYNAMRREEDAANAAAGDEQATHICRRRHHHHHHHHHRRHRCDTSSSSVTSEENEDDGDDTLAQNAEENGVVDEDRSRVKRSRSRHSSRHRSRSSTRPRELQKTQQSVGQAGRQFISACSLSLVDIINQLTTYVRRGTATALDKEVPLTRHVPTLVVLFIVITFGLLLFLLSGRNVHTHHWDYFNPPGGQS